jgi:hypothetical protein
VIITGIIRVIYGYIPSSRAPEYTKSGLWSTVHIIMGIICACLPTLRPLFPRTHSLISHTSSAIRRRYYDFRGVEPKDLSASDSGIGSSTGYGLEVLPFKGAGGQIETTPIRPPEPTHGGIVKDTTVEIESAPAGGSEENLCSANIKDPRRLTMWLDGPGDPDW